jgi:hypothetical protein
VVIDNPFDEMRAAVERAKDLNRAVDLQVNSLVDLLEGRLEHVSTYRLKRLKAALKWFNANTGRWKA